LVFQRASKRENIAQEIAKLRNELKDTRARIREAEDELFWASYDQEARASQKWNRVFAEIERRYGQGTGIVNCVDLVRFSDKQAEILLDPNKWPRLLTLPVEVMRRWFARRPVIELHRLAAQLPGSQGLQRSIARLFGEVAG